MKWFRHPAIVVFLLSLGAIRPILTPNQTPLADDFAYHLHRLIALRHLVSEGIVFTRWFPDLALGYGYPLFNFAAPLPYYVALSLSWVFSAETAIQLALALAVMLSGWGMFQLQRCFVSSTAALIGATAWLYAPYLLYDTHFRANLGEVFAIAALPFALWGIIELARTNRPRWLILTALSIAAPLLSHNVIGLLLLPTAAIVAVTVICVEPKNRPLFTVSNRKLAGSLFTGILLGMGMATFFWLPAFVEKANAAFPRLMSNPAYSVFNNFLSLGELFALPPIVYTNRINPSPPITLGFIPVALAIIGWVRWRKMSRQTRTFYGLLTLAMAIIAFMVTGYSEWMWQQIALLQFFQFPWRLLAFGALFVAVMVGFSAEYLPKPLQIPAAILIILNAQSWTLPAYTPKGESTIADVTAYEQAVGTLGTTVAGEYLPSTVDVIPDTPADWLFLGEGIVASTQERGFRPKFTANTDHPTPQTLTLNQFAFAGWQATVNGASAPITPSEPHGLITIPAPAGTNTVTLQFGTTPLRTFASFASFASFALLLLFSIRTKSTNAKPFSQQPAPVWMIPIALLGLLFPTIRPGQSAENTLADYGDVRLVSADFPQNCQQACADDGIPVRLTFAVDASPTQIVQSTLALRDANGVIYSLPDNRVPARFRSAIPSNAWPPDHTVAATLLVDPIDGIPSGDYTLELTVFDRQTLQPLRVQATNLATLSLGNMTIEQGVTDLTPPNPLQVGEANPRLTGYGIDRTEARPGDPVLLSLLWESVDAVTFTPEIVIGEEPQEPPQTYTVAQSSSIQTRHLLTVPADVSQVEYAIVVQVNGSERATIPLAVDFPERTFAPPAVEQLIDLSLGEGVRLYGVTVGEGEGEISAELIWHPQNKLNTRYRVFVHLIDENDNILAQSDADPANWTRPTTGWLPDEYISDTHTLSTPDQPYRLRVGLYDPITLTRPFEPIILDP